MADSARLPIRGASAGRAQHDAPRCLKDTLALPLGSWGEVVSRVVVELMLDALGTASTHILRTGWPPHSSSACFVLTTQFLKVYDLAQDKDFARARFPDAR